MTDISVDLDKAKEEEDEEHCTPQPDNPELVEGEAWQPTHGTGVDVSSSLTASDLGLDLSTLPHLYNQNNLDNVHYPSPVAAAFPETDHGVFFPHTSESKDVKDADAIQGVAGLYNLGNTCFMNAGLQCLFSNVRLTEFFLDDLELDEKMKLTLAGCFSALLSKLWSGQYSIIHPCYFKDMVGLYHPQFQDYRQHDCQEFLALLLDSLHEQLNKTYWPYSSSHSPAELCDHSAETSQCTSVPASIPNNQSGSSQSVLECSSGASCDAIAVAESSMLISRQLTVSIDDVVACGPSGQSQLFCDDSNLSEPSLCSLDSVQIEASHRSRPLPRAVEPFPSPRTSPMEVDDSGEPNEGLMQDLEARANVIGAGDADEDADATVLNAVPNPQMTKTTSPQPDLSSESDQQECTTGDDDADKESRRLPSLEDLYMKDTKTLNTNVLATEFIHEEVTTDSEKFHKQDNTNRPEEEFDMDQLNDLLSYESTKGTTFKPIKDTNLLANLKDKFVEEAYSKKLFSELEGGGGSGSEDIGGDYSINNIKRIKIDEKEKNLKMQEKMKVNTDRNLVKELVEDGDEDGDDEHSNCLSDAMLLDGVQPSCSRVVNPGGDAGPSASHVQGSPRAANSIHGINNEDQWQGRYFRQAEKAWSEYLVRNRSVIVDSFQGQFKSTIICYECHHRSVTFEPFMYLSVPLPHAMDRQMSILFVPCDNKQPIRYLLTLNKQDHVRKLKRGLLKLIGEESCDITIAEVLDNHIARILDENTMLRFVNDNNRTIYAFEMIPAPQIDDNTCHTDDSVSSTTGVTAVAMAPNNATVSSTTPSSTRSNSSSGSVSPGDVFTNMGSVSEVIFPQRGGDAAAGTAATVTSTTGQKFAAGSSGLEFNILNNIADSSSALQWASNLTPDSAAFRSGVDYKHNMLAGPDSSTGLDEVDSGTSHWEEQATPTPGSTPKAAATDSSSTPLATSSWDNSMTWGETSQESPHGDSDVGVALGVALGVTSTSSPPAGAWGAGMDTAPLGGTTVLDKEDSPCSERLNGANQWKSCAICLEEMVDGDLMIHAECGGTLCHTCLQMSFKHYADAAFLCPVCSCNVNPVQDFIQLNCMADYKPKTRILSIPVVNRLDVAAVVAGEPPGMQLFGHPNILYLPSQLSGELLYECVDRIVPCLSQYSVILTDGQGYRCSRCLYTQHCSGCQLSREDPEVCLQPGDHLAVKFTDLMEEQTESAQKYVDHKSMEQQSSGDPLTLHDCFEAFTESEDLDVHNPWYCPRCMKNQCAKKTMTVWRYPDTLVVYLKRFVFHQLSSTKIDSKVIFPVTNLDLSDFISGPQDNLTFDLHSCVCHFGGVSSGHYTAYANHPVSGEWWYYNDETVVRQDLKEDDFSNAYILFYQKHDSSSHFKPPPKYVLPEEDLAPVLTAASSMDVAPYEPPSQDLPEPIIKALQGEDVLDTLAPTPGASTVRNLAPDSTNYDFYS